MGFAAPAPGSLSGNIEEGSGLPAVALLLSRNAWLGVGVWLWGCVWG